MDYLKLGAALTLALIHLGAGKLHISPGLPRSIWLSMSGGVSVAYVFLHLLPELASGQQVIKESADGLLAELEHHAYLVAFAGLVLFYGLERAAKKSKKKNPPDGEKGAKGRAMFWSHIASFSVYNVLIAYLLINEVQGPRNLVFFLIAMGLHFIVNDYGLHEHYRTAYAKRGRWILAAAVVVGAGLGYVVDVPQLEMKLLIAFLAGGVILNVLKEELPEERESRFGAFFAGGALYAGLLMAL